MCEQKSDASDWYADEVQVHKNTLYHWLQGKFSDSIDLDDIVQEAMTRVWHARTQGPINSPKALLFTVAHNLALDRLRREKIVSFEPITETTTLNVYVDGPTPADSAAHQQELNLLTQAIQSLPDRCRQVLTLRKIYGLPQKEIAVQLGISEHTVEVQVANGMKRCAAFLARFNLP